MTSVQRAVGLVVAVGATVGLVWASRAPFNADHGDVALLRLAWRARPERIEHCVAQSPEALASLPAHMRQATICEGINASYRLVVQVDRTIAEEALVEPGGLRRDRPLYVFRELALPAGDHLVTITFTRVEAGEPEASDEEAPASRRRDELREAVPAQLQWSETTTFAAGQVRVISYDPTRRELFEVRPQ